MPEPSAPIPPSVAPESRRAARTAPQDVAGIVPSDTPASRRAVIAAVAAAGVVAAGGAFGATLLGGGSRSTAGAAAAEAVRASVPRGPGSGTLLPSPSPTTTPTPTPTATPTQSVLPPVTVSSPGSSEDLSQTTDRDASYVAAGRGETPMATDPAMPLRPGGADPSQPVPIPVEDTLEARLHLLRRAGLSTGAAGLAKIDAVGLPTWLAQQLDPARADPIDAKLQEWFPLAFKSIDETQAILVGYNEMDGMRAVEQSTFTRRLFGEQEIREQVVDVFANLLNIPPGSDNNAWSIADYHYRVIRGNALGKYSTMLHECARHPAMMTFLDNRESTKANVNENYGRELLELHTVGIDAGYTEEHVRSSSVIMSGRRVKDQRFVWQPEHHATGPVQVLDFADLNASADAGLELGDRYISYLAHHPNTARTVAKKLAVRFVTDSPSDEYVSSLAQVYLDNDTDIRAVVVAIFGSVEFWSARGTKLRRPTDDITGVIRSSGVPLDGITTNDLWHLFYAMKDMGDAPLSWAPVNGYPDVAAAWMSSAQITHRWNHHRVLLNGQRGNYKPGEAFKAAVAPVDGMTVRAWGEALSVATIGEPLDERDLNALCALLALGPDDALTLKNVDRQRYDIAALFFDSSRYLLR